MEKMDRNPESFSLEYTFPYIENNYYGPQKLQKNVKDQLLWIISHLRNSFLTHLFWLDFNFKLLNNVPFETPSSIVNILPQSPVGTAGPHRERVCLHLHVLKA